MSRLNKRNSDRIAYAIALSIAILGPLIKLILGFPSPTTYIGMYFYWMTLLLIYVAILIPLTFRRPLTLIKLVILGVMVEDFFSTLWKYLFRGGTFLPFFNWYTQHFPFLGSLGEPSPYILIPRWYLLALLLYFLITVFQYRKLRKKSRKAM